MGHIRQALADRYLQLPLILFMLNRTAHDILSVFCKLACLTLCSSASKPLGLAHPSVLHLSLEICHTPYLFAIPQSACFYSLFFLHPILGHMSLALRANYLYLHSHVLSLSV